LDAVVGHSIVNLNFDASKSGGATALPAPMVVTPLLGWKKLEELEGEKRKRCFTVGGLRGLMTVGW